MPNPSMPGGSFSECLIIMQKQGKDEDSAKRICGSIKAKVENLTEQFELNEDEKKCVEQYTKVEEVKTYAEVEAEIFALIESDSSNIDEVIKEIDKRIK